MTSVLTFQTHSYLTRRSRGDRYLTSNVQIFDPATEKFSYTGQKYKYFTTKNGLRIMAFGILFDMTRESYIIPVIMT